MLGGADEQCKFDGQINKRPRIEIYGEYTNGECEVCGSGK